LKLNRLLVGTLALIVITSAFPAAFADGPLSIPTPTTVSSNVFSPSADEADSVFFGGTGDGNANLVFDGFPPGKQSVADDFELEADTVITDVHLDILDFGDPIEDFNVIIYFDDGGLPGEVVAETVAIKIERMDLGDGGNFRYWFDLEEPVLLDGGVRYWLEISQETLLPLGAGWTATTFVFGEIGVFRCTEAECGPTSVDWTPITTDPGFNFVLTGHSTLVGGEFLPIDSTALLLAGAQTFSWMIPVILSGIGIGLFVVSRKSE